MARRRGGARVGGAEAETENVEEHPKLADKVTVGLFISVCNWLAVCSVSRSLSINYPFFRTISYKVI